MRNNPNATPKEILEFMRTLIEKYKLLGIETPFYPKSGRKKIWFGD